MTHRLSGLLRTELPIVLGPFGGLSSVDLTAAVSNGGGLGSYGLYGYTADRIRETDALLRAVTDRPYALNLWLPTGTERDPTPREYDHARAAVAGFFTELDLPLPEHPTATCPASRSRSRPFWLSPHRLSASSTECRPRTSSPAPTTAGSAIIATATTVDEAIALQAGGVDAIVATGAEAAGHRVSFLEPAEQSLVGTFALVPQVADAVTVPVIAAGGIADRRGVAAAIALGADGVQVGTAFLRTRQSAANDAHRYAITHTAAHGSVLTTAMSGRLARGAPNRAIRTIEAAGSIAPFPAQNWLTGRFRTTASRRELGDLQSLWLGQASPLAHHEDAELLLAELARGLTA